MFFMYFSPLYWVVMLATLAITGGAALHVRRTYRRWAGVRNSSGLSGQALARQLLDSAGLQHIPVEIIEGEMTDNYDPGAKVLRISQGTAYNASVASEGIVAHEIGHAMQDAKGYVPMKLRSGIVPAANLGAQAGPALIYVGLLLMWFLHLVTFGYELALIGLTLFSAIFIFQVVTLPVEVDASRRAMILLRSSGLLVHEEVVGARKVLTAAALTYIAAMAASALQLLYYASLVFGSRRN
jgi:Zn-dependent membrane protease YugP